MNKTSTDSYMPDEQQIHLTKQMRMTPIKAGDTVHVHQTFIAGDQGGELVGHDVLVIDVDIGYCLVESPDGEYSWWINERFLELL